MFAGSFSMVVGVTEGGGDETVDMVLGFGDGGLEVTDRGIKELEGLFVVVAGRAGPIT